MYIYIDTYINEYERDLIKGLAIAPDEVNSPFDVARIEVVTASGVSQCVLEAHNSTTIQTDFVRRY